MSEIDINRKNMFNLFREAEKLGPYSEFPLLQPEVDPQLHFSRNDLDQPFFLICEKDCVIAQLSGEAIIDLRDSSVSKLHMEVGDHAYIPGGVAHRIRPLTASVHVRYKAKNAGREGVLWTCDKCDGALKRMVWDASVVIPQIGYAKASLSFNADAALRTCSKCGAVHPPIDLSPYRWEEYAKVLAIGPEELASPRSTSA